MVKLPLDVHFLLFASLSKKSGREGTEWWRGGGGKPVHNQELTLLRLKDPGYSLEHNERIKVAFNIPLTSRHSGDCILRGARRGCAGHQ